MSDRTSTRGGASSSSSSSSSSNNTKKAQSQTTNGKTTETLGKIRSAAGSGDSGFLSKKLREAMSSKGKEGEGTGTAMVALLVSLIMLALQIYILYYTFKLERIGCDCAADFRRTYAQVYIILSFAVYVALGIMEALTNEENMIVMSAAKAVLNGIMFLGGIVYVIFVWQYISKLRRIKCACSTSLARDIWEVVNYIHIGVLILGVIILAIAMLYSASIYQSILSTTSLTKN